MSILQPAAPAAAQAKPEWGRLPRFCQRYECGETTAYAWLAAGLVDSRKVGGIRLWQIGTVRGVDNDLPPEPSWAIPAAARPENEGRHYGRRKALAVRPSEAA